MMFQVFVEFFFFFKRSFAASGTGADRGLETITDLKKLIPLQRQNLNAAMNARQLSRLAWGYSKAKVFKSVYIALKIDFLGNFWIFGESLSQEAKEK